jgi:arylsulfatase A-like enzyme
LIGLILLALPDRVEAARRPNIVVMMTDDQRWDALGVVQREQGGRGRFPWLRTATPNLDRIAAEGYRFKNAFVVSSLCSPSRAAFLTGRYNHLNGVANNQTPFPVTNVTYATLLRAAGYRTGYFGKWHMARQRERPGFDEHASYIGQGAYHDATFVVDGVDTPTTGWVDDVSTGYAIEFIRRHAAGPFLLVLGFKSRTPRPRRPRA